MAWLKKHSSMETHGFFRIFCSNNKTLEALATRISIFVEHPNLNGNLPHLPQNSSTPHPVPVQRPSHHDIVFQCGTDQLARDDFSARFVTIEPDDRKLLNSTNVLGLLVDTLLKDGFHLIDTKTVSQEKKIECYMFERSRNTQIVVLSETPRAEHLRREDTQNQLGEGKKSELSVRVYLKSLKWFPFHVQFCNISGLQTIEMDPFSESQTGLTIRWRQRIIMLRAIMSICFTSPLVSIYIVYFDINFLCPKVYFQKYNSLN
ncbi:putative potassium channel regulatory protein [Salmo trutta]|uniref:putative potassium channel regulatory protein n=1 Tax=Salmo trutta TaxID=8032 RepID=UPI0011321E5C|nr:putative potassium channel regulatory protein [Salmo trutta]